MVNNIAADLKSLQQQMAQLLLAINKQTATPTAAMYPPLINAAYGSSPHQAYTSPPPPQQYQAYKHYQQPSQGYGQQSGGRGGHVGRSGRGRGRGKQTPYMQQQPQGYGQQLNAGREQSQGFYQQTPVNRKNIIKTGITVGVVGLMYLIGTRVQHAPIHMKGTLQQRPGIIRAMDA